MLMSPRHIAISLAAPAVPQHHRASVGPIGRRCGERPPQPSVPAIEVSVACEWAARAVGHALRAVGAEPVEVQAPGVDRCSAAQPAAIVYDLSPWNRGAAEQIPQHAAQTPILLYLPPSGAAFAALSHVPNLGDVRLQVQARDGESLGHLREAVGALVRDIPRVHIMTLLTESMPNLSSAAFLFAHGALRVLGSGRLPTVGSLARALALTPRTLQRRFTADGLPAPKAFIDWLTLAHVYDMMDARRLSMARAAAGSGLTSNDLYRTRKRVQRLLARNGTPLGVVLRQVQGCAQPFSVDRRALRTDCSKSLKTHGLLRNCTAGGKPDVASSSFAE